MTRKVVVTGLGMLTPVGHTPSETFDALCAGRRGVRRVPVLEDVRFNDQPLDVVIGGTIEGLDSSTYVDRKEAKRMDPFILYSMIGAVQAWRQSGLPEKLELVEGERAGTLVGVGLAGVQHIYDAWDKMKEKGPRRISPLFIPSVIGNMAPGYIAMRFNLRGPNWTPGSGGASGGTAIGEALTHIRDGRCDLLITGGSESTVSPMVICGYANLGALSTRRQDDPESACRPFDSDRDGTVIGEGAGILLVEAEDRALARGAKIICEVAGTGSAKDKGVPTDPQGPGMRKAVERALADAEMEPNEVDYINAHGSGGMASDRAEMHALRDVFGDHAASVHVSSIKGATGHLLGAAGAVEAAVTAMAVQRGMIPPTANLHDVDGECGPFLHVQGEAIKKPIRGALSTSFGIGGVNTALVFKPYSA